MNAAARPVFGQGLLFIGTGDATPFRLLAVRPDGQGDVTKTHIAWRQNRGVPSRSSSLLVDDLLYMVNETGIASCLEARTGKTVWQQRLHGENIASPLYAEGRIYCFNHDGLAHVLAAGREAKILARNQLDAGCMASPAVAGQALFVRTRTHLYRIEQGAAAGN
jgi:outer membrane protein assembly factor BamB